ncbi:MAG: aminotransferase class V-fold PLP-dependent enzyme [Deltaproteobacteria bacterium]|nr:aminotransferase class V-fold PLP-dependent enzyme [Deltaproteobacteria bacterium]
MSTNPRIYLDFNATSPLGEPAREAIASALGELGNPSSIHAEGRQARDRLEEARNRVAGLFGRPREQVVFTSGGTEANTLGVRTLGAAAIARGLPRVVVTSPIEHPSLVAAVEALGWERRLLDVTPGGAIAVGSLAGAGLLAVAAVNHELGTVLDPRLIANARAAGVLIHVDAVQAAGKQALAIDADALAISAHKLGGPQGVGAVALAIDADTASGGHQERGRRGGTENTLGIVGFGAAAEAIDLSAWPAVVALGERLEAGLRAIAGVRIHGAGVTRIGGTINAGFSGARGEAIVIALDLAGVAVSTGAACTSGTLQPSPVLRALGQSADEAREAVRFSLGRSTTAAEIDRVLALLPDIVERARRHRA